MNLLTTSNFKVSKTNEFNDKYLLSIMHLYPNKIVCPDASPGCMRACLVSAGYGKMKSVTKARAIKTKLYLNNTTDFLTVLEKNIDSHVKKAKKENKHPSIRLNGTSDIAWEKHAIIKKYSNVLFYDYTKTYDRMVKFLTDSSWPKNYYLTFSRSETNEEECKKVLELGGTIAVVFKDAIPETYYGYKTINGDEHDLRFLDGKSVVIGLSAKGLAKEDKSGFLV